MLVRSGLVRVCSWVWVCVPVSLTTSLQHLVCAFVSSEVPKWMDAQRHILESLLCEKASAQIAKNAVPGEQDILACVPDRVWNLCLRLVFIWG